MKYLQAFLSLFLVIFVIYKVGLGSIASTFLEVNPLYILAILLFYFLQIFLNVLRFKKVSEYFGHSLPLFTALKVSVKSLFFGLVAFGGLGEFFAKTYQLKKHQVGIKDNISLQIFDKIIALSGLVVVAGICLLLGGSSILKALKIELNISNLYILSSFVLLVFLIFFIIRYSRFKDHVTSVLWKFLSCKSLLILKLSILSNFISIVIAALSFKSLNINVFEKIEILYSSPIISFICAFPLFFNGWGVREVLWKYLFLSLGLSINKAVVGSLLIGIMLPIVVSILFAIISLSKKNEYDPKKV